MVADLGVFTAAELRAGGINSRGFLQPILPAPDGADVRAESRAAAEGLASRGLLVRRGSGWRPVGRFEQVLEAAAVARSLVAIEAVGSGPAPPRLAFGSLGVTDEALLLNPEAAGRGGYGTRLLQVGAAALELAGALGFHASGSGGVSVSAEEAPAITESDPGWGRVDDLVARGVATVRVESASISQPQGPLLQRRLTVMATPRGDWLLLGTRQGQQTERAAAPAGLARAERVMRGLLAGGPLEL